MRFYFVCVSGWDCYVLVLNKISILCKKKAVFIILFRFVCTCAHASWRVCVCVCFWVCGLSVYICLCVCVCVWFYMCGIYVWSVCVCVCVCVLPSACVCVCDVRAYACVFVKENADSNLTQENIDLTSCQWICVTSSEFLLINRVTTDLLSAKDRRQT